MDGIVTLPKEEFCPGVEGAFNLPRQLYHNHQAAPGISRSLVVELLSMTAAHAHSVIEGKFTKVETQAMTGGSIFDIMLLEPDLFMEGKSHWVVPPGMKLSTKPGLEWKKEHPGVADGGLPYIWAESDAKEKASLVDMKGMIESLMSHRKVRRLVESSMKQESAFAKDPNTGLMRKVRPDMRAEDNGRRIVLADLKSTFRGGAATSAWIQHCARMNYHIQDSYYSDVYRDLWEAPYFVFVVVERKPPYAVRLFQLDVDGKKFAREEYSSALQQFRKCQETGVWPAYDEEIRVVSLPNWRVRLPEPDTLDL